MPRKPEKDRIPNVPDLRGFDLDGPCKCGRSGRRDDVHYTSCPHIVRSRNPCVLEAW